MLLENTRETLLLAFNSLAGGTGQAQERLERACGHLAPLLGSPDPSLPPDVIQDIKIILRMVTDSQSPDDTSTMTATIRALPDDSASEAGRKIFDLYWKVVELNALEKSKEAQAKTP